MPIRLRIFTSASIVTLACMTSLLLLSSLAESQETDRQICLEATSCASEILDAAVEQRLVSQFEVDKYTSEITELLARAEEDEGGNDAAKIYNMCAILYPKVIAQLRFGQEMPTVVACAERYIK